jgi:hypothetical protein
VLEIDFGEIDTEVNVAFQGLERPREVAGVVRRIPSRQEGS